MRPKEIIFATYNRGKFREVKKILQGSGYKIVPLFSLKGVPSIKEGEESFSANAAKKALITAKFYKKWAVGEDSGLVVNFLGGLPGVKSARFSKKGTDESNIRKLLKMMEGVPWKERRAQFICKVALASPKKVVRTFTGRCSGFITFVPQGRGGYGYDPVFFIPQHEKTFAELPLRMKNTISHRYKAFSKLKAFLEKSGVV